MQPDQASFTLEADNGAVVAATIVSPPPNLALWQALFDAQTPVKPFRFDDYADRPIVSFPVRQMLSYIKDRYRDIATQSPEDLPSLVRSDDDARLKKGFLSEVFRDLVMLHGEQLRGKTEAELTARLESSLEHARQEARTAAPPGKEEAR